MRRSVRLSDRDRQILRHVQRHGITTIEALRVQFFDSQSDDAVRSTLKRLCGRTPNRGLLTSDPLDGRRVYYRLAPRGARAIGVQRFRSRPLGLRALAERYAVLWFVCIDCPQQRALFNPREFPEQFDIGPHRLPRANFYVEQSREGRTELGFLLVDYQSDPRRIVRRATQTVGRFLERGWFDAYLQTGAMTLALLTTSAPRADQLTKQIRDHWRSVFRRHRDLPQLLAASVRGLAELLTQRTPR